MKTEALAKVFGPIIVGYGDPNSGTSTKLENTKKQQIIVETLLNISSEFWEQFTLRPDLTQNKNTRNTRSQPNTITTGTCNSVHTPTTNNKLTKKFSSLRKKITYFGDESPYKQVRFAK